MKGPNSFPCKFCGGDVPVEKIRRGPWFVFCTASCSRKFKKATPDGAERQAKLIDYHGEVKDFIQAFSDRADHPAKFRREELERQIYISQ